jgi:hypothetical protein
MGFGFNPAGRTAATNFTPFIRTGLASAMQSTPGAELGSLYVRMPFTLTQEQIKPAPEMGTTFDSDYLIGLGTLEQRMLILVDIDKLMSSAEMGLIEKLAA